MSSITEGGLGVLDLSGAVAVVSGGSSGIGAATARRLAQNGASVVVGYNSGADRAAELVAELAGDGHSVVHLPVTDAAAIAAAVATVSEKHGRCDVLVNSAGTTKKIPHASLDDLEDEYFDSLLQTNVRGPFGVTRAFVPLLRSTGNATVINVSSISASTGLGSNIAYCAAKGALDTLTMSLGRVLGPEIRVIGVAPAAVDTAFVAGRDREAVAAQAVTTPLRVLVDADDVAVSILGAVTHLRISTGTTLVIDGGKHL